MRSPKVPWWPGSVETSGGLHIHHLVWGIVTIMLTGFLSFAIDPGEPVNGIIATLFGVGCGLTLDEFALWLRLEDVYWADEGRASVDAVIIATIIGGMILVGIAPLDGGEEGSVVAVGLGVGLALALAYVAISKGKLFSAVTGAFIPIIGLVAAIRLARPDSRWARKRYSEGKKLERARRRDARVRAFQRRLFDAIGGTPESSG